MRQKLFYISALLTHIFSCSSPYSITRDNVIEIQIPLNKTIINANASYLENDGKISLNSLTISAMTFTEENRSNDTTYFAGLLEQYIPPIFENGGSERGDIKLSLNKKWVFLENISSNLSQGLFYKQAVDTVKNATINFRHFPVYPHFIKSGESSEIIREENTGKGWTLNKIYRKFDVGGTTSWDDEYGRNEGLFLRSLQHTFNEDSVSVSALFDASGVVISQYSLAIIFIDNTNPANNDTVYFHQINRRLRGYSNPLFVPELKTFADKIINNPLKFYIEN